MVSAAETYSVSIPPVSLVDCSCCLCVCVSAICICSYRQYISCLLQETPMISAE